MGHRKVNSRFLRKKICSGNAKLINMSHKQGKRLEEMASLYCTTFSSTHEK
jgi:hypothetical protein